MIRDLLKKLFGREYPMSQHESRGPVLEDGRRLWDEHRGENYKDFWSDMAQSRKGACLATRGDDMDRDEMHRRCEYVVRHMIRTLRLNRQSVVFEVGCGMGPMAWLIAPQVKEYHGADISTSMLVHARKNLESLSNVHLHQLERCDLSIFPDCKFDAGIFEAVLIHMDREDACRYIEETFRVLKPGGRAYFMFHCLSCPSGYELFQYVKKTFCDGKGGNHLARDRSHTPEEVRLYCTMSGFVIDEEVSQMKLPEHAGRIHDEDNIIVAICEKPR